MKKRNQKVIISELLSEINLILSEAEQLEESYAEKLSKVHPNHVMSARNLLHYWAMRQHDLRNMQRKLRNLGLSRLANAESHVLSNILMNKSILSALSDQTPIKRLKSDITPKKAIRVQKRNAKDLLGHRSKARRTRIMVTLPTDAAAKAEMVSHLIEKGMNCCRINCAHDDRETWQKMVYFMREAERKLNNKSKITMDLAGPKIRTFLDIQGPKIVKIRTSKNVLGEVVLPTALWLFTNGESKKMDKLSIPIIWEGHVNPNQHQKLYFLDTRKKKRQFVFSHAEDHGIHVLCYKTTYVQTGMNLFSDPLLTKKIAEIGELPSISPFISLQEGDELRVIKKNDDVLKRQLDVHEIPHVYCGSQELFDAVSRGETMLFDDGKIRGKIISKSDDEILVRVEHTRGKVAKLRSDKGINVPESKLEFQGLTVKDTEDLQFAVQHADTINMSFVNSADDVTFLIEELEKLEAKEKVGVILKIETKRGFNNLLDIILEGMQLYPLGIMIARGDLAVQAGWNNIGRIQEEILSICQAAHIPDIWATQVLENLAKQGIPSRPEITDAIMAQRADCIMLNKGPFIMEAVDLLHTILVDIKPYFDKRLPLTPAMEKVNYHA